MLQQQTGGWIWQPPAATVTAPAKTKKSGYLTQWEEEDETGEEDEEEEEETKKKKKKNKEKQWEKETEKQRAKRYRKYEKMSETTDADKQNIKNQVNAMYRAVIAQEKVVKHLKSLYYQGSTTQQIQENQDLLDEVVAARKELVDRIQYLEVAFFPIPHGAVTMETGTQRRIQDALTFIPFS